MTRSNRSATLNARREYWRKGVSGCLSYPGEKTSRNSVTSNFSVLTMRGCDTVISTICPQLKQREPGTMCDADDVGSFRAARRHLSGLGGSAARISSRQRFLFITTALCAPGTAAADVGNALREERGRILWGAGQYFAHIFSPSHRNMF